MERGAWTLTILAATVLGLVRMAKNVVDPASFTKSLEQQVSRFGINGDDSTCIGAHKVVGHLQQIPVLHLSSEVAFLFSVAAEEDGPSVLRCAATKGQKNQHK